MIGSILSGSELGGIVSGISKSRKILDDFCKKLKEHEKVLKQAENNKVKVSVELNEVKLEPAKIDNKNFVVWEHYQDFEPSNSYRVENQCINIV